MLFFGQRIALLSETLETNTSLAKVKAERLIDTASKCYA